LARRSTAPITSSRRNVYGLPGDLGQHGAEAASSGAEARCGKPVRMAAAKPGEIGGGVEQGATRDGHGATGIAPRRGRGKQTPDRQICGTFRRRFGIFRRNCRKPRVQMRLKPPSPPCPRSRRHRRGRSGEAGRAWAGDLRQQLQLLQGQPRKAPVKTITVGKSQGEAAAHQARRCAEGASAAPCRPRRGRGRADWLCYRRAATNVWFMSNALGGYEFVMMVAAEAGASRRPTAMRHPDKFAAPISASPASGPGRRPQGRLRRRLGQQDRLPQRSARRLCRHRAVHRLRAEGRQGLRPRRGRDLNPHRALI
jgi:hypothetical protein